MSDYRTRRDLRQNVQDKIERILEQDFNIARHVLPTDHLALMSMEVCCSIAGALMLVPIQRMKDGADRDALFEVLLTHMTNELRRARPRLFEALDGRMAAVEQTGAGR